MRNARKANTAKPVDVIDSRSPDGAGDATPGYLHAVGDNGTRSERGMRFLLALLMALHGLAHGVGFVVTWRLTDFQDMPHDTTLLSGTVDVGETGIRVVGVLWLIVGLAFVAAAAGAVVNAPWWPTMTVVTAVSSLPLSIAAWPESRIGVAVNLLLLVLIGFGVR
jgi:hypothetical protein